MTSHGLKLLYLGAGLLLVIMGLGNAFVQQQSLRDYYEQYEKRYYIDGEGRNGRGIIKAKHDVGYGYHSSGKDDEMGVEADGTLLMDEQRLTGFLMGTVLEGREIRIDVEDESGLITSMRELEEWMGILRYKVGGENPYREYRLTVDWIEGEESEDSGYDMLEISVLEWRDTDGE